MFRYQPCPNQPPIHNNSGDVGRASEAVANSASSSSSSSSPKTQQLHPHHAKQQQLMLQGCQTRDHRPKVRSEVDTTVYRVLLAHRDAICLSPAKKTGGIKIGTDSTSISLPSSGLEYVTFCLYYSAIKISK